VGHWAVKRIDQTNVPALAGGPNPIYQQLLLNAGATALKAIWAQKSATYLELDYAGLFDRGLANWAGSVWAIPKQAGYATWEPISNTFFQAYFESALFDVVNDAIDNQYIIALYNWIDSASDTIIQVAISLTVRSSSTLPSS
jgi:hypothetical protein